jgi:hypothetical protein
LLRELTDFSDYQQKVQAFVLDAVSPEFSKFAQSLESLPSTLVLFVVYLLLGLGCDNPRTVVIMTVCRLMKSPVKYTHVFISFECAYHGVCRCPR